MLANVPNKVANGIFRSGGGPASRIFYNLAYYNPREMNNRNLPLYIDIIFCAVLLPAMIMLLPIERWLTYHTGFVLLLVGWFYVVYLLNRKLTIPLVFRKKKYLAAVLLIVLAVGVTYLLSKYRMHGGGEGPADFFRNRRPPEIHRHPFKLRLHEQGVWFLFLVVTAFSIAVGLLTELYRQMLEKKELEQEKSKAELALYKAQINPHFLFNTLNTLYGLVVTRSDKAEQAFVQFTDMMKYLYSNGTADFIPVSGEVDYIRQYIGLQKLRLNEHTEVVLDVDIPDAKALIAPMLLITFVENAFKYGVSSHMDSSIYIAVSSSEGKIGFRTRNRIFRESLQKKGAGIGIQNCRKRLALIYPGRHTLEISDDGTYFDVRLTILTYRNGE